MFGNKDMNNNILSTIKHEEKYNKTRNVISAYELLKTSRKRFTMVKKILSPLYRALMPKMNVTNISARERLDDCIIEIEYLFNKSITFIGPYNLITFIS